MLILYVYISILAINGHASITNDIVIEYFQHKKVPSVIGYSCNSIIENTLLLKNLNKNGVTVALQKLTNVSAIHFFGNTSYYKLGIFVDISCFNTSHLVNLFLKAANHRMYNELHSWLILGDNLDTILSSIDDEAFGVSSDFAIAISSDRGQQYALYDVFNFGKERGGLLNLTYLGEWKKRLNIVMKQNKLSRRSNLHGLIFRAVFFNTVYKPENMGIEEYFQDYSSAQKEGLCKFGYNLVKHLSELFNFSLAVVEAPKWEVGDRVGPLVRALNTSQADLTGCSLTMNVARTHWIKYVHQDWPFRTCFIFRNPQPNTIKVQEILRPFADNVWYLIVVFVFFNTVILALTIQLEWNESAFSRLSQSIILVIGALCQQSTSILIKYTPTRIAFLSVMVFGLLIYDYYSALVVSARLNEPIIKINDSLIELVKLQLKLCSEYMVYLDFFLKKDDWETKTFYKNNWLPLPESERYVHPEDGMQRLQTGSYAYHIHPEVAYPFIERSFNNHEICELMEVHLVRPTLSSFAVSFNSSIVEIARIGLTKMSEVGLRRRQITRWQYTSRKPRCRRDVLYVSSINIYEFSPHLLLLMIGLFATSIVYVIENIIADEIMNVETAAKDKGATFNITFLGNWDVNTKLSIVLTQSKLCRRSNLHGIVLRTSFFKTVYRPNGMELQNYFQSYSTAKKEGQAKFGYNMIADLSQLLNFSLKCMTIPKWEPGDRMGPLVQSLVNNDADINGVVRMSSTRTRWIKFVSESFPTRTCFIFRNRQTDKIKFKEIFRPFDGNVWYIMIFFMGFSVTILTLVARFDCIESGLMRISESSIIMVGSICQQGTNAQMTCMSTRIAFFSIAMFGLLIYNYYSTSVVSARFSEPIRKINDSLSQLSKLSLKFGAEFIPWFVFYITRDDWETKLFYEKRWLPLPEDKRFIPPEEGLKLMRRGGFAYHTSSDVAYPYVDKYFDHRELCELMEVHLIRPTYGSFGVKMNSTIVELMRYGFVRLSEVGLHYRQVKKWKYRTLKCREDILTLSSVDIYELAPHLILLVIGLLTSILLVMLEIFTMSVKF